MAGTNGFPNSMRLRIERHRGLTMAYQHHRQRQKHAAKRASFRPVKCAGGNLYRLARLVTSGCSLACACSWTGAGLMQVLQITSLRASRASASAVNGSWLSVASATAGDARLALRRPEIGVSSGSVPGQRSLPGWRRRGHAVLRILRAGTERDRQKQHGGSAGPVPDCRHHHTLTLFVLRAKIRTAKKSFAQFETGRSQPRRQ